MTELAEKRRRVRSLLNTNGLEALLLSRQSNLSWYLCGAEAHVATATETAVATLILTADRDYLVTSNIEAPRWRDEELSGITDVDLIEEPWYGTPEAAAAILSGYERIGADTVRPGTHLLDREVAALRYSLLPEEAARYSLLGYECAAAMGIVAEAVAPGWQENVIAGALAEEMISRNITPTVLLVAADDRIGRYRHPLPTALKMRHAVMMVIGGRRGGLVLSMTRLIYAGSLPLDMRHRHKAVTAVDAAFISATRPGAAVSDIFAAGCAAYATAGFEGEWHFHHQGGATGYAGRDYKGTLSSAEIVQPWQAFAWNPSIRGTKSEDTILAAPDGVRILSAMNDWPMISVETAGSIMERPDILIK